MTGCEHLEADLIAADLTAEHVGHLVHVVPLRSARRLVEVEQGGPFEIPEGLPVPILDGRSIPSSLSTHLVVERIPEEDGPGGPDGQDPGYPLHVWCIPSIPVTVGMRL